MFKVELLSFSHVGQYSKSIQGLKTNQDALKLITSFK